MSRSFAFSGPRRGSALPSARCVCRAGIRDLGLRESATKRAAHPERDAVVKETTGFVGNRGIDERLLMNRATDEQPPEESAAGPAGLFGALHGVEERDPKMLANVLYVAAWAVEVLAVTAGLVISVMIALDAFHQVEESKGRVTTSDYIDMVAATIPFILVAIVEATKIPVAGAAYTARTWGWRVVFTATLFFLALVTFETMLNGFERNFSNLTYVVSGLQKEKIAVEEKLELLEDQRTEAASLTAEGIESRYTARRNDLVADRDQNVARVQSKISELKGSIEDDSIRALQDELDHLREQREMLSTRREQEVSRLNRRMDERISGRREELAQERALLAEQLRNADALLSEKIKQKESAVADATIFTRGGVVERFDQDITRLREDRDRFQAQLEALGGQGDDEEIRRIQKQVERTNQKFDADARADIQAGAEGEPDPQRPRAQTGRTEAAARWALRGAGSNPGEVRAATAAELRRARAKARGSRGPGGQDRQLVRADR